MRSAICITATSLALFAALTSFAATPRVAIAWEQNAVSERFVSALKTVDPPQIRILDPEMSQTAIRAAIGTKLYNLTNEQGQLAASVAGSDFVVIVRAEALRRNSFELGDHYEAWAAIFLVFGKTGVLIAHRLDSGKGKTESEAIERLLSLADVAIKDISSTAAKFKDMPIEWIKNVPTAPEPGSIVVGGFVAPIPYSRIKPEYTSTAYLYSVTATVDIEIELDEMGKVTRTQIVRWAGFGLDESVEKAVRSMQWRPAYFGKEARPIRFVAQYNFRKPV